MSKIPTSVLFCIALFFALFGGALLPKWQLVAFGPFLVLCYYRLSFSEALWLSCGCGLVLDLLTVQLRFGLCALNFTLTTLVLFHQKRHFFEDKPIAISLFAALFSFLSTLFQLLLFYTFDAHASLLKITLWTDLICMPLADGIYAFACFFCPMRGYEKLRRYIRYRAEEASL